MTLTFAMLVNFSWYLCRKKYTCSYGVVAVLGGSVSDLMVTAVCLQKGFGQVKIC